MAPFQLSITIRIDTLALETEEDFVLSLVGLNTAGINILASTMPGHFVVPMIRVVIEDVESKLASKSYTKNISSKLINIHIL